MILLNTVLFNSLPDPFSTPALAPSGQNKDMAWDGTQTTSSLTHLSEGFLRSSSQPPGNLLHWTENYKDFLTSPACHPKSLSFTWLAPTYAQHCVGHQGGTRSREKKTTHKTINQKNTGQACQCWYPQTLDFTIRFLKTLSLLHSPGSPRSV